MILEACKILNPFQIALTNCEEVNRKTNEHTLSQEPIQVFAHEVKRPFSLLKILLNLITKAENSEEIKKLTEQILPKLNCSIDSVDHLIKEMMVAKNKECPIKEFISPEKLIYSSLSEIIPLYQNKIVNFHYNLNHTYSIKGNYKQIQHVFSNIIENAFQAINLNGQLSFSTKDIIKNQNHFVQFSIKNTASFIAKKDIKNIFNSFFTKEKEGGTGLGLAICKKTILDNDGQIWCHSKKGKTLETSYTEFFFTLPSSLKEDDKQIFNLLPKNMIEQNQLNLSLDESALFSKNPFTKTERVH